MVRTIAILLYAAAAFGIIAALVINEVWWKTPEAQRQRLQRRVRKQCRRMEKTKARIAGYPLLPSTAPNRIPDPIVRKRSR